jgi:hypothetical protein
VRDHLEDILQAGGAVLVITPSKPEAVAQMSLPLLTVCDPQRAAYQSFGLERGKWSMFLRRGVLSHYLGLMFRGWLPFRLEPGEDPLQLGGDFIVSKERRLAYAHRSADPADRPAPRELVEQLRRGWLQQNKA